MQIIKRDGSSVDFDINKITIACSKALGESKDSINWTDFDDMIRVIVHQVGDGMNIETVQDIIEDTLVKYGLADTARKFIKFRTKRDLDREHDDYTYGLLTKEFLSHYKHMDSPMTQLGDLVYYRTYSRFLESKGRREYWWETVRRAVEYNCSLAKTSRFEAEELFDNIFRLKQFLSGRTFWIGGTEVANKFPMANYNCAFRVIDGIDAFKDLFYLLLIGSGVGVRVIKSDIESLPPIRTNVEITHEAYIPIKKEMRLQNTELRFIGNVAKIVVGDNKESWTQALDYMFKLQYLSEYNNITEIRICYNNVRPKGEALKTFGGTASGHYALMMMFVKIDRIIKKHHHSVLHKLRPIDCLDITNIIGEGVVIGGVRRTAEIVLVDSDDDKCISAKSMLYTQNEEGWVLNEELGHRQMSNNSIYYKKKPTRERLKWQIEKMRYSGEPGWVNEEAGAKRRPNFNGVNPCGEILLDNKGLCNLTTLNVFAFVDGDYLDEARLLRAQSFSARAGYRMTCVDLELHEWDKVQKRDRLLGVSLTGWQDMVNAVGMTMDDQAILLRKLRDTAQQASHEMAHQLGGNPPLLVTTVKPEGTLSQLPTVSSGVHYSHSPYYIRRVRINANDPIVKVCEDNGYVIKPEVGQVMETCTTKVVEFPVKAPIGKTKYNVSAIEQLENYKMFMKEYVDHNCSITVHVRNDEWDSVEQWVWDNWDDCVALSFLSLDDNFYELLPYEAITEEEYNKMIEKTGKSIITPDKIAKYEKVYQESEVATDGCDMGVCPIK